MIIRRIQDNLRAAMDTLWTSLVKLGHRGETLEDLERNGEALVQSSASFVAQVTPWHTRLVYVCCFCCDRKRVRGVQKKKKKGLV